MPFVTYADLLEHVAAYTGKGVDAQATAAVRRAAQQAVRELQAYHPWSYYRYLGRVATVAQYLTGTVAYDHTGGAYERVLTLSGGTWPTWAGYGVVVIADVAYPAEERKSATELTLKEEANPGADLSAGTGYVLARDTYPLPDDFQAAGDFVVAADSIPLTYRDPAELVKYRRTNLGPAKPLDCAVVGGQLRDGKMALKLWPPPDLAYQIDFDYRRRPRPCVLDDQSDGTVTVTAGSAAVTGTGTSFGQRLVGSIIRLGRDSKNKPGGLGSVYPFAAERRVKSVESATALTAEAAWGDSASRVAYACSDPVDVEPGAMETLLYRMAEKAARLNLRMETVGSETGDLRLAGAAARDADSRYKGTRQVGMERRYRNLTDYPIAEDE